MMRTVALYGSALVCLIALGFSLLPRNESKGQLDTENRVDEQIERQSPSIVPDRVKSTGRQIVSEFALGVSIVDLEGFSYDILTILGVEGDSTLAARSRALEKLSAVLTKNELDALFQFLLNPTRAPNLTSVQERVLVNDLMKALRLRAESTPKLGSVLAAVFRDGRNDLVIRDYAIQQAGSLLASGHYNKELEDLLWEATEAGSSIAGTALLSLRRSLDAHSEIDSDKFAKATLHIAQSPRRGAAERATALALLSEYDSASALRIAKSIVRQPNTVVLQAAAVAVIAQNGSGGDINELETLSRNGVLQTTAAVESAISANKKGNG